MNYDIYQLLDPEDAQELRNAVLALEWTPGQARTAEATKHYKSNYELPRASEEVRTLAQVVQNKILRNQQLMKDHMINKIMQPKFNRYDSDTLQTYRRHGDSALMGGQIRTDLAMTLFLTKPEDYDGGELVIEDSTGKEWSFKPEQGQCIIYPCWNPHWVTEVTRGQRVSAITWLESKIRDIEKRELMRRFYGALCKMEEEQGYSHHYTTLSTCLSKLSRMWMEYSV